mgnify:CR=1 FL=1
MKVFARFCLFLFITLLTQIGGFSYLAGFAFRRRILAFFLIYAALTVSAIYVAPMFGRVALPCFGATDIKPATRMTCVLNRQYVVPAMADVARDLGQSVPGTLYLDANFPFIVGFPLLPHLSHDDGRKLDLALPFQGGQPSPIGYWFFANGPTNCPDNHITLRWDMGWIQPMTRQADLDEGQMIKLMRHLHQDPRIGKILLEPHLKDRFAAYSDKVRFQGCRAARHDDHIHIQL